jgi:hypothetical protein
MATGSVKLHVWQREITGLFGFMRVANVPEEPAPPILPLDYKQNGITDNSASMSLRKQGSNSEVIILMQYHHHNHQPSHRMSCRLAWEQMTQVAAGAAAGVLNWGRSPWQRGV